jgi:hypothetical protein
VKSEARKIAELQCKTQLESQALGILSDPLWSTILGFVAVHELRKRDLVGPVADDLLYAGIIAVNAARQPGLQDLAGKGIEAGVIGAGAAGLLAGKVLSGGGAAAGGAAAGGAAAGGALLPVAAVAALAAGSTYAGLKLTNPKNPTWKRILGTTIGGPITSIHQGIQAVRGK